VIIERDRDWWVMGTCLEYLPTSHQSPDVSSLPNCFQSGIRYRAGDKDNAQAAKMFWKFFVDVCRRWKLPSHSSSLYGAAGHCWHPAYVEGRRGQIMTYHGAHVVADASAHNEKVVKPLYTLRFQLSELYPECSVSSDRVHLDLSERHFEAAQ
jgi:hypothetical protein